jgi:threonine/homoserine/homoserine lactone efflux protein
MIFLNIFLTSFFAAISPGPNLYFVISQTNISKRKGFFSAAGVIAGVFVWLMLLSFGFKFFLKQKIYIIALNIISFVYLFYLGLSCILKKNYIKKEIKQEESASGSIKTFLKSFALALFNVEIAIFYGAIFSNILTQKDKIFITICKVGFIADIFRLQIDGNYIFLLLFFSVCFLIIESFVFFSSVFVFSLFEVIKKNINKINKILGIVIIYYSLNILYETVIQLR